jgi:hypothetical protein
MDHHYTEQSFADAMNRILQHYFNPLHIYCRLRDLGMAKGPAIFLCRIYEIAIFRYFSVRG